VNRSAVARIAGIAAQVVRTDQFGAPTYEIIVPDDAVTAVWDRLAAAGAAPSGQTAFDAYRIGSGIGMPGTDFDDRANPLEAGLLPLIDFVKGCYVGQEVIARLVTYDKVQRQFVRLSSDGELRTIDELIVDGRSVGRITSVSTVPGETGTIALAYLRNEHATNGAVVSTGAGVAAVVKQITALEAAL
jgi:folate-binding protein YgfZ